MKQNSAVQIAPSLGDIFANATDCHMIQNDRGQERLVSRLLPDNVSRNDSLLAQNATTLRRDEHERLDTALLDIGRETLHGLADIQAAGLRHDVGGLGTTISTWERVGDMTGADVSMDGMAIGQSDRLTFDEVSVPVPIFHKDFFLPIRTILSSRRRGEALDTTQARVAGRMVMEKMEESVFDGLPSIVVGGNSPSGYLTHADRNTYSITAADWTAATLNGANMVDDCLAMLQLLFDDRHQGQVVLYVSEDIWLAINEDYSTTKGDHTIKDRLLAISEIASIKPSSQLATANILMVRLQQEVVDVAVAQDVGVVQWNSNPMGINFKVFGALVVRVKSTQSGQSGIVHGS